MTIVSFSTGLGALNSINQIQRSEHARTNSIAKISSSLKIRKAADSVADSAIGTKIKVEISSLKQILIGTAQAQSVLEIAEGALNELTNTVMRMNTLAKQSVNGSNSDDDRAKIDLEYQEIMKEVNRIADSTNFNSKKLLAGNKTIINDSYDDLREDFLGQGGLDELGNYKKGGGFESIKLDSENASFAYQITYNKDTQLMKVTDKATGNSEEIQLSRDIIKEGQTESVAFTKMDLKVKLNSYFNKNSSIGAEYASGTEDNNYKLINKVSSAMTGVTETPKVVTVTAGQVKVDANNLTFAGTESLGKKITNTAAEFKTILGTFGGGDNGTLKDITFANNVNDKGVKITELFQVDFNVDDAKSSVENFKISSIDENGVATFEAEITLKDNAGANTKTGTIKGTVQLETKDAADSLDLSSKMVTYNRNGMVTDDNKTYELKKGEYISSDGNIKNVFGENVGVKAQVKDAGIDANNYKISVTGGSGIAGDITDLGVYMTGTNGAAKFVIHAADGDFISEGTYDLTEDVVANKTKAGNLELRAGLNEITLSRQVQETDQTQLPRKKDTIKISFILNNALNKIEMAKKDTAIEEAAGGFLNGKGIADEDGTVNNTRIAVLNELKNSKVFYQEKKDTASFSFRVGTGSTSENVINLDIKATTSKAMNIEGTDVLTVETANEASKKLQAALDYIQEERAKVGVTDNRIGFANNNINTSITNSQAAVSAIFDLDVPSEIAELSQTEMKQTASIESLSRDMRSKQGLLKLF